MHTEWSCQNTAIFGAFGGAYPASPSGLLRRRAAFLHEHRLTLRGLQFHIKTLSLRLASRIAFLWPNRSVGWFQFSILQRRKDRAHADTAAHAIVTQ